MTSMSNRENIIHTLFHPRSVAVIGASTIPMRGGNRILENLIQNKYPGIIYPVNPKGGKSFGLKFYQSLFEINDEIDVAIIFVPNTAIPSVLKECIQKGIKGAIIQAAGFEEVGDQGLKLRDEIKEITDNFSKIRVVGPNCTGLTQITDDHSGFFSAFIVQYGYKYGNIAVISQSGMLNGGYFIYLNTTYPEIGFRYLASIGNKMDLGENEFLEYFIEDPTVKVIAIYLESFKDPRKFIELCNLAKNKYHKTVIVLKGGITTQGSNATLSHTGAIAENSQLIQGILKQSHVVQASCFYDLFKYARTFSAIYNAGLKMPNHGNISLVTVSGGAGTVLADLSQIHGLNVPELSLSTYSALEKIYPAWMPPNKYALVDLWPAIENAKVDSNGIHKTAINTLLQDDKIEGILMTVFYDTKFQFDIQMIIDFQKLYKKPIFCWLFGNGTAAQDIYKKLSKENICCFYNLEEMVKNFKILINSQ